MSNEIGKQKPQTEQTQVQATQDIQPIKSTELADADLDKVAGGGAQPHMLGTVSTLGTIVTAGPPDPTLGALGSTSFIK